MADETRRIVFDNAGLPTQPERPSPTAPATRRIGDGAPDATRRLPDAGATQRTTSASEERLLPLGVQEPGKQLCTDCLVARTLYPHESQRPGLYLCSAAEGEVIVKVAALEFPPKPELWQRLPFLHHTNVLRTYRILEERGFFFELQEYCTGGTLESLVPNPAAGRKPVAHAWIRDVLLPQVCEGLAYLHEQDIIHRDIKPANIYLRREQNCETIVLGDFDIASVLEQTHTSRETQRAGGTWLYTAPEAFPRFVDDHASSRRGRVTRSADYYSLGITIIELLLGTTSLHLCQLPDLFDFYLQGGRVEIPQGIPGDIAQLLRGLLIRDRRTRWGADEIRRWLRHENTDDDLRRIQDDDYFELARASRPYRLQERTAVDLPGLAEAMFREQEIAKEDIITGDVLLNWIGDLNPILAREIRRDRDRLYLNPVLLLHQTIMRCDPTRPFIFADGTEAVTAEEWITHLLGLLREQRACAQETLCSPALLFQLEAWLRFKSKPETELADRVACIHQAPPRVWGEELTYLLQPARPYVIMRGMQAHTPQEVAQLAYGPADAWQKKRPLCYDASYQRWFDGALCAWLRQRGLADLAARCDETRTQLGDDTYAAFETVLRLLDPTLPPVEIVLDLTEVIHQRAIAYGTERVVRLPYTTRGCGVPFGALAVHNPTPGVRIHEHLLRQRDGSVELTLDAKQGQRAFSTTQVTLDITGGIARLANAPVTFSYRIEYPSSVTVMRVLAGAGIGLGVLGLPRIAAALLHEDHVIVVTGAMLSTLWERIYTWRFPYVGVTVGILLMLVCLYYGIRVWITALRSSEL
ncbi:MAG TPA: protein kinase [Armatimonadota bacterium]